MSYGILLLRVVLGLVIAAHGSQKLFGAFGGPGLRGAAAFFGKLRFRVPLALAVAAALAETGGGLLLALGLLTPLAGLALAVVMLNAAGAAHVRNGFWSTNGGFEYNLLIWTGAVALAATGGGRFSIDAALGLAGTLGGLWWGVGVAAASVLLASVTLTAGRRPARPTLAPVSEREAPRRAA
jgi:putative oxidoreductase